MEVLHSANKGYFDWFLDNAFNILVDNQEGVFKRWEKDFETDTIQKAYEQAMEKEEKKPELFQQIVDFCKTKINVVNTMNQLIRENAEFLGVVQPKDKYLDDYVPRLHEFINLAEKAKADVIASRQ